MSVSSVGRDLFSPLLSPADALVAFEDEHDTKDRDEASETEHGTIEPEEETYPALLSYLPFGLLVNISAVSFGTTVSFTGPTINAIISDLKVRMAPWRHPQSSHLAPSSPITGRK